MSSLASMMFLLGSTAASAQTPYAGMQSRQVKALLNQQIADLRAALGMGLALAAELNGFPGPWSRRPSSGETLRRCFLRRNGGTFEYSCLIPGHRKYRMTGHVAAK